MNIGIIHYAIKSSETNITPILVFVCLIFMFVLLISNDLKASEAPLLTYKNISIVHTHFHSICISGFPVMSRPEQLYWVLVLGLQYSWVLGFPNTCSLFYYFSDTIQYYTTLEKS